MALARIIYLAHLLFLPAALGVDLETVLIIVQVWLRLTANQERLQCFTQTFFGGTNLTLRLQLWVKLTIVC